MNIAAWLPTGWFGAFLVAFPSLFTIVDPIGNAIIISQMTARRTHRERLALARAVTVYTLILLTGSLWVGAYLLDFFGVTIGALRVAGGLVIAVTGWQMLNAPDETDPRPGSPAGADSANTRTAPITDIAFFPVTLPFTAGPGAIAAEITFGAAQPLGDKVNYMIGVTAATAAIVALVWLLYSYGDSVNRVLGRSGSRVMMRLIALIVLAIGVQIVGAGLRELLMAHVPEADL
jgi:multiple antibiotic resistance protein